MQCTLKLQKSAKLQATFLQNNSRSKLKNAVELNYFVFDRDKLINMETYISKMFIQMQ